MLFLSYYLITINNNYKLILSSLIRFEALTYYSFIEQIFITAYNVTKYQLNDMNLSKLWEIIGKPGMLQSTRLQRVGHNLVTEQHNVTKYWPVTPCA